MHNYSSVLNITNYHTQFIDNLKYQVKTNAHKYNLDTAKEVESIFIQILLQSMRSALKEEDLLENNQSNLYTEIYDQQISKELTKKGMGLADIILTQIEKNKLYT